MKKALLTLTLILSSLLLFLTITNCEGDDDDDDDQQQSSCCDCYCEGNGCFAHTDGTVSGSCASACQNFCAQQNCPVSDYGPC